MEDHANAPGLDGPPGGFRRRLGRGLNALLGGGDDGELPDGEAVEETGDSHLIPIDCIDRNPFQPRKEFAEEGLQELADSIKLHGLLQPLLVRPYSGRFQLIAGERRWLAAQRAGLQRISCRLLELEDRQVYEVAIEENVKRKDLGVLEKATAFRDYLERFNCNIEELAGRLSMNRATVSNFLRLLDLPDPVKKALGEEKISNGHARALLTLDEEDQIGLCKRIVSESLSVRKTEQAVREIQQLRQPDSDGPRPDPPQNDEQPADGSVIPMHGGESGPSSHVLSLQEQLRQILGAKVEIQVKGKDAGKIIIPFDSSDEFEGLIRRLRQAA